MSSIQTKKLTKFYGKSRGIVNMDLTVESGEFFGFIRPNGAGKSTTKRTLLGLIKPTSGISCLNSSMKTSSKDFVKAINAPFGYNLSRFKNLSIDALFDKNESRTELKPDLSV